MQESVESVALSRRSFVGEFVLGAFAGVVGVGALSGGTGVQAAYAASVEENPWAAATLASVHQTTTESAEPVFALYATPCMREAQERNALAKRVLVVVDYQVDFVNGALGKIDTALAIEEALYERVKSYQDAGDIVIYTADTHPQDNYLQTREGQVNPPHCVPGTEGWEVYGKLRELLTPETAILLKKGTYGSTDLPAVLEAIRNQGVLIQSVEMAGVSTTCRVLHNAIILYNFFPELPIIFDDRTTASYTDELTAAQLDQLEGWGFIIKRSH